MGGTKDLICLLLYFLTTVACLLQPGAAKPAEYLGSDNDLLFQCRPWKANLRVLGIEEIKSLPHVPMSHPFVERLIGSVRREMLDQTFFWTATNLLHTAQQQVIKIKIMGIPAMKSELRHRISSLADDLTSQLPN